MQEKCTPMLMFVPLLLLLLCNTINVHADTTEEHNDDDAELTNTIDEHVAQVTENRLAAQLFAVLDHYKQIDPVGMPGAPIPDPFDVPDMKKSVPTGTLNMLKVKAYGLSKFRIVNVNADLKAMKAEAGILLNEMLVKGQYTLKSFFGTSSGPFFVSLKLVNVKATATLTVLPDGQLTTERIKIDIKFDKLAVDFQNLGVVGSAFQGIVNSAPIIVFDAMKPFILQEADKQLRTEINTMITKMMGDRRLPNSISPLDMAIAEGRRKVRALGYDPYRMPDYNRTVGVFSAQLANTWISGISSFYRVGDMVISMANNTLTLRLQLGTQQLSGAGQWEVGCGLVSRIGHLEFTVQHLRVTLGISQPLDTRKRPQINDLQLDLGNIQVRCDGAGTLDYLLEFVVNVLPNLLRYQIMDAIENPLKMRVQEKFNSIDVEKAIKDNFDKIQAINSGHEVKFDFKLF